MRDSTLLFKAPIAVGRIEALIWEGKEYDFTTPVGQAKSRSLRAWTPLLGAAVWHYYEDRVRNRVFARSKLKKTSKITLLDSTRIEVRQESGRVA
jgi:hypothetical protein